jgi:hypothetical protein
VFIRVHLWLQLLIILPAAPAAAHIKALRGHLIDIVGRSDVVVIAVVTQPASASATGEEISFDVVEVVLGDLTDGALKARTSARLVAGERQVVFLKREAAGYRCTQPSGTRFPATLADDGDYRRVVVAVAAALRLPDEEQIRALRAALIPALRAASMPLRYHAALDLSSLSHEGHDLSPEERKQIEAVRSAADADPTLRPILDALLR